MPHARRNLGSSMPCIIDIVRATIRRGSILRPFRKPRGCTRASHTAAGAVRSVPSFAPEPGEIVATDNWCSRGFANTRLDLQLKKHAIQRLIIIGLIAHTCIEATVRFAAELGYEVTVVKDPVADYSDEHMHAALDINIPNYASSV